MRAAVSVDTVLFENIMMGITGALDAWGMKHIHPAMMWMIFRKNVKPNSRVSIARSMLRITIPKPPKTLVPAKEALT